MLQFGGKKKQPLMGRLWRRIALISLALGVYGCATYAGYVYFRRKPVEEEEDEGPDFAKRVFDKIAPTYDETISSDEKLFGILRFRKHLISTHARGRVLEVAVGTGRNFEFYDDTKVKEVVAADFSEQMLNTARNKLDSHTPRIQLAKDKVVFVNVDVNPHNAPSPCLPFASASFDTVVDTFGLCSVADPVGLLRELGRVCKSGSAGGRVLLLEHGRSATWPLLSRFLDQRAAAHYRRWGCRWNRDIDGMVAAAGLVVVERRLHHLGTCYEYVAAPPPIGSDDSAADTE